MVRTETCVIYKVFVMLEEEYDTIRRGYLSEFDESSNVSEDELPSERDDQDLDLFLFGI